MPTYQRRVKGRGAVHAETGVGILVAGAVSGAVDAVQAGDAGDGRRDGGQAGGRRRRRRSVGAERLQSIVLARTDRLAGDRIGHQRSARIAARRRRAAGHAAAAAASTAAAAAADADADAAADAVAAGADEADAADAAAAAAAAAADDAAAAEAADGTRRADRTGRRSGAAAVASRRHQQLLTQMKNIKRNPSKRTKSRRVIKALFCCLLFLLVLFCFFCYDFTGAVHAEQTD